MRISRGCVRRVQKENTNANLFIIYSMNGTITNEWSTTYFYQLQSFLFTLSHGQRTKTNVYRVQWQIECHNQISAYSFSLS